MSLAAPRPHTLHPSPWRTWLLRGIALMGALAMLFYGLLAIDTGIVNFKAAGNHEVEVQRQAMQARAEAGQPLGPDSEVAAHSGAFLTLIAKATSPTYAFGEHGLSETAIHYANMPRANGVTLSVHNVLGGITMLFGALQFWPAFRRRFPRWHRAFGGLYILAAQGAMIAAMVFLVRTPVHLIYDQLTFYIGLWGLAIGVTLSLWMAIYSMARKRIAQHQGWMALNYGMLLTAPIQRYGWVAFGAADPNLRQLEGNYAVTAVLIPLSVMIGYGLFSINRWLQAERPAGTLARIAQPFAGHHRLGRALAWAMLPVLALAAWATVDTMLLRPGLAHLTNASTLIPAGVLALDEAVIVADAGSRWAFTAATLLGLVALAAWLRGTTLSDQRMPPKAAGWLLAGASFTVGALLIQWGLRLGMPSFATQHGGSLHVFGGAVTVLFSVLMGQALRRQAWGWAREWSWFLLACLLATPSLWWALPTVGHLGLPSEYIQTGHAWRLAAYGQWMPLIGAFLCAIHSEATHAKLAR